MYFSIIKTLPRLCKHLFLKIDGLLFKVNFFSKTDMYRRIPMKKNEENMLYFLCESSYNNKN